MALERQEIEKRDFPIGRRGYDPDAVDRHLREIAEEVAELREQAMSVEEMEKLIVELEEEMLAAADELRFEYAAKLRDEIRDLGRELERARGETEAPAGGR